MAIFTKTKKEVAVVAEPKSEAGKETTTTKGASMNAAAIGAGVIVRPLVTEKAAHLAAIGQYVFAVNVNANRIDVRRAIRSMYGILPVSVNIQNIDGKLIQRGRIKGQRKNWKKAIVTLPKGKTIEVYEGV